MFDGFTLSIEKSRQLKNYRKDKNFNNILLKVQTIDLSTYHIKTEITYKRTIPLNLFEKYAIRLIEKAEEIQDDMNIKKISKLLFLDEKLVEQNLQNLEAIEILNGAQSDRITINRDENAEYLNFENKFKKEKTKEEFDITETEKNDLNAFINKWFKNNQENNDKKFCIFRVLNEQESSKEVILFIFDNTEFRLLGKQGFNDQSDLKFFYGKEIEEYFQNIPLPDNNIFCHRDEFLPESLLVGDKKNKNKVFLSFREIDFQRYQSLFIALEDHKTFILTNQNGLSFSPKLENRIFTSHEEFRDFIVIDDKIYFQKNDYIYSEKIGNNSHVLNFKEVIRNQILEKIAVLSPNFQYDSFIGLEKEIQEFKKSNGVSSKKEARGQAQKIGEEKNRLYGAKDNKQRKRIDELEKEGKLEDLQKKYPIYWKNRNKIFQLKIEQERLSNYSEEEIEELYKRRNKMIPSEKKEDILKLIKLLKELEE